jgi:hypothetical protein
VANVIVGLNKVDPQLLSNWVYCQFGRTAGYSSPFVFEQPAEYPSAFEPDSGVMSAPAPNLARIDL